MKGETARVSGLRPVLVGCAGFFSSGALLPARSWLPRVGSWVPGPIRRLVLVPGFCVVSFSSAVVVEMFGEQTGANPKTELSAGTPTDAMAALYSIGYDFLVSTVFLNRQPTTLITIIRLACACLGRCFLRCFFSTQFHSYDRLVDVPLIHIGSDCRLASLLVNVHW